MTTQIKLKSISAFLLVLSCIFIISPTNAPAATITLENYLKKYTKEQLAQTNPYMIWESYRKEQNEPYSEVGEDENMKIYYEYTTKILSSQSYEANYKSLYTILYNLNRYEWGAAGGGTGFAHGLERISGETNWIIISKTPPQEDIPVEKTIENIQKLYGTEPFAIEDKKEMQKTIELIEDNLQKLKTYDPQLYKKVSKYIINQER
jgi:hypothetical protein